MDNTVPGRKGKGNGGREGTEGRREVGKTEWGEGVRRHTIHIMYM